MIRDKNILLQYGSVLLGIVVVAVVMMSFTGLWPTGENPYASYRWQAQAWLDGRLDVGEKYTWLELAIYDGKYYVSFPPFPSYVLLPFCLIGGDQTPDHWIMLFMMVLAITYAFDLFRTLRGNTKGIEFLVFYLFLCNGYMFVAAQGWVWFFAQSMCFTLSLMALAYAAKGRGGSSLFCLACAFGCRPMVIVYLPMIFYLILQKTGATPCALIKRKKYWFILPSVLMLSYALLNYFRFGSFIEFGHNYLPEFVRAERGQFDISYVLDNLKELIRLPDIRDSNKRVGYPTFGGFAFYLVNPILITYILLWVTYAKDSSRRSRFVLFAFPIMFAAHVLILLFHRTLGGWQFGNRYLQDLFPFLYCAILLMYNDEEKFCTANGPLFFLGLAINLLGTVATYNEWL